MADRGPQRSEDRSVTDKDREASDALHVKQCPHGGRDACLCRECRAEAIATARAEEREACAKVAAGYLGCDVVATAIRARGEV